MACDTTPITEHGQGVREADVHRYSLAAVRAGHRVPVTAHVDVRIPGYLALFDVTGIERLFRQRSQCHSLGDEPIGNHLLDPTMEALIRIRAQPVFQLLVEVGPILEGAVALEEVVFDITHHAFHFAFGPGAIRTTGFGDEAVVIGQLLEARVELHRARDMLNHRGFLVVHPHLLGGATEPRKRTDQRLIRVLGVVLWRRKHVETPGVPQAVHSDVHLDPFVTDLGEQLTPVVLQLFCGVGLEANRCLRGPQHPFGVNIVAQHSCLAGIAQRNDLAVDDLGVPDAGRKQLIHFAHVRP